MRQRSKRFLRFYDNRDGMVCMHGAMDPDTGARVKARISAIAKRMWRQDKHQPRNQRRTPEQRDIDALHAATAPRLPAPVAPRPDAGVAPRFPVSGESQPSAPRSDAFRSSGGEQSGSRRWDDPASQSTAGLGERGVLSSERSRREPDQPSLDHPYDRHAAASDNSSGRGLAHPQLGRLAHPRLGRPDSDRSNVLFRDSGTCSPGTAPPTTTRTADGVVGTAGGVNDAAVRSASGTGVGDYRWRGRPLPLLRVSTSLGDLKDGLHRAGITDTGDHLSAQTLRRLACDAQIIPVVLNSKSRVIDVGRRTRVISEALRIAVIHRDKHCVWPGCTAAPDRCDCHHVEHWINGGPTNLDNLALLCHRHHILLHEAHYKLQRHANTWTILKPDNTPLHANPTHNTLTRSSSSVPVLNVSQRRFPLFTADYTHVRALRIFSKKL